MKEKEEEIRAGEREEEVDQALRPTDWDGYVGQEKTKGNLKIMIKAAEGRGEPTDHILFYGQAGLGKTTLAILMAREMGMSIRTTSGPTLKKVGDLILTSLTISPKNPC